MDDARQAGGGQHGAIRWQAMQGNMAVDDKTRGGGWRNDAGLSGGGTMREGKATS